MKKFTKKYIKKPILWGSNFARVRALAAQFNFQKALT